MKQANVLKNCSNKICTNEICIMQEPSVSCKVKKNLDLIFIDQCDFNHNHKHKNKTDETLSWDCFNLPQWLLPKKSQKNRSQQP